MKTETMKTETMKIETMKIETMKTETIKTETSENLSTTIADSHPSNTMARSSQRYPPTLRGARRVQQVLAFELQPQFLFIIRRIFAETVFVLLTRPVVVFPPACLATLRAC